MGFSFIFLTVNLFRHSTLIEHRLYMRSTYLNMRAQLSSGSDASILAITLICVLNSCASTECSGKTTHMRMFA